MKILADKHIPFLNGVAEQFGEVQYLSGNLFTREAIKDKDVLIVRTVTRFDEENLSGSNVKLICSATIGYDHIDIEYCDANGIAWRTAPGCNAASVEQYITASLLYLAKKYHFDLRDKTIGIVGVGNVGSKVELACLKLGMNVLLNDPPRVETEGIENLSHFVDIDSILNEADIITFHTPITKVGKYKTYHLADDNFYSSVKRKPFIINAARGRVTSNKSLKKALQNGLISGIVLDCWENEPDIDPELVEMADIATPHIAGYSADGKWTATKMSINNLREFFKINKTAAYQHMPLPEHQVIDLKDISAEEQLSHAVWHTYNPVHETVMLKKAPEKFHRFRSHYPLRREYHAYKVLNASSQAKDILKNLGFNFI